LYQLAIERLIPTIEMVDAVDGRFAFRHQRCDDEADRGTQVSGHYFRAMQPRDAAYQGRRALQ
jgi:hypothetical protein